MFPLQNGISSSADKKYVSANSLFYLQNLLSAHFYDTDRTSDFNYRMNVGGRKLLGKGKGDVPYSPPNKTSGRFCYSLMSVKRLRWFYLLYFQL